MANYVYNTIYLKGSKTAMAGLINKGLRGNQSSLRVDSSMSGEEIVRFLETLNKPLEMRSFIPRPRTFDRWDTTNDCRSLYIWFTGGYDMPEEQRTKELKEQRHQAVTDYMHAHPDLFRLLTNDEEQPFCPKGTKYYDRADYDRAVRMMCPDMYVVYRRYCRAYKRAKRYQQAKYGVVGWYDWNCRTYGCKWSMPFEQWKLEKETDDSLVLSAYMETPWSPPIPFFDFLNKQDGITLFAHGYEEQASYGFFADGIKDDVEWFEPDKSITDIGDAFDYIGKRIRECKDTLLSTL